MRFESAGGVGGAGMEVYWGDWPQVVTCAACILKSYLTGFLLVRKMLLIIKRGDTRLFIFKKG